MPSRHASSRALRRAVVLAALIALGGGVIRDARSASVANFMTAKSLPDATVAVLDPESGTSSNPGSDVALEVGDIILFKFAFSPAPANSVHGVNGYLTEYVPPGTELVGVRFTDAAGNTIRPNRAGLSIEGCQGGSLCNSFSSVPCATGTCSFQTGSIAQVYADTGVFYATDPDLSPSPNNLFLNTDNGIPMTGGEEPRAISPEITQLLNDTSGPYNAHNDWDYDQVRAYGGSTSVVSNGDGNTPYLYGSPVAGPDTFYRYEATDTGGAIQLNNVLGPWLRIQSPGSRIGTGPGNIGASTTMSRVGVPTGAGHDLTPATAVSPTAVRFAGGEARVGEPVFAEVALRVLSVPIDPTFGAGAGNVDCAEATGSDISSKSANSGGGNNAWPYYIGAAQCVFLRLKFDVEVSKPVASVGDTLHYVLNGKNLSLDPETGVVAKLKYVESDQTYVTATPAPTRIQTCPGESNKTCVEWDLGTLQPGDEYVLEADIDVQGQGGGTNVVVGQYESNELDAINPGGFETTALTVVQPVAIPKLAMTNTLDPTANFAAAGSTTWAVNGTLVNAGTTNWGNDSLVVTLPTGWSITNGQIVVGGTTFSCTGGGCATSNVQTFSTSQTYASLQSRAISFAVTVPAGAATGLYTFDVQAYGDQNVFGKFETLFPEAVTIPVGAVRTAPPILQCQPPTSQPIISTQPTISGTSEADAAIRLLFSLIQRGTATADGAGAWTVANYLPGFGELYGGLEVRATAQAPGKLISVESASCIVAGTKQCSDGLDNDGDGLADFPADPGCDSPSDNTETDPGPPQCSDGLDNDGANGADWPADPSCDGPTDDTEDGTPSCSDGIDNDGDGLTDFPDDPDCSSAQDGTETFYRQCQDGLDNDGDGEADFAGAGGLPGDDGCDALFDDDESDTGFTPVDTRARLLIALDSSGSMNWETCSDDFTGGDGSTECAGADVACACNGSCNNALADDSRLFKVKNGIANVVAAFGEVEYSLMRFHQKPENFLCPTAAAGRQSGGWQGGGAAPCAGGFASGDLLVSFTPNNEPDLLTYINHDSDSGTTTSPGTDWEVRGSGTTPLAGILDSAHGYLDDVMLDDLSASCRPYRVILVTDGAETCGGDPVAAATSLRNAGILVHVIGFATPDPTVIANLDAIADAGGTGTAILASDDAALSAAMADIIEESILVEACNGLDDDCDGRVDEDFPDLGLACDNGEAGSCFDTGVRVCATNGTGTVCDAPPGVAGVETCNGLDDDCDGLTDEDQGPSCTCNPVPEICNGADDDCDSIVDEGTLPGVGEDCGLDIGACVPGQLACVDGALSCENDVAPIDEICNGLDDDCDTFVDEIFEECYEFPTGCTIGGTCEGVCTTGVRTCDGNALGECVGDIGPSAELCNGLDDDCNGLTDDGLGLGDACDNGQDGVCHRDGVLICDGLGNVVCSAPTIPAGLEVCNGLDDDCDGNIDEDLGAPIGDSCGGGGACSVGTFECVDGAIECVGQQTGTPEVCNGLDEDCDLQIDEDLTGYGGDCIPTGIDPYTETGICRFGHLECVGGVDDCRDAITPEPEISCNGIDEDCDGMDDQTCPDGQGCVENGCRNPCAPGEFPCPFGFFCDDQGPGNRFCVPDPCAEIQCQPGFYCDRDTETCVDLCDGVNCPTGTTCTNGLCQDCFALGCATGEVCVRNTQTDLGECQPDLCFEVTCAPGEFCSDGACVPLTCDPECPTGQLCTDGVCADDPCAGVECAEGQICDPDDGRCHGDRCIDVTCPGGEACNPYTGECVPDPCAQIDCPAGYACVLLPDDSATCRVPPTPPSVTVFAGGGGCSTGRDGAGGLVPLLLGVGWLVTRRRSRGAR